MYRMLTLAALGLLTVGTSTAQADAMEPYGEALVDRSSFSRISHKPSHAVITDDLHYLVSRLNAKGTREARGQLLRDLHNGMPRDLIRLKGEDLSQVQIYVHLRTKTQAVIQELSALGFEVEAVSPGRPLVQGTMDMSMLDMLAAHPEVREVSLPNYGMATSGAIQTEGDAQQGTNWIRYQENANGAGITIGVISNGLFFDGQGDNCSNLYHERQGIVLDELPLAPFNSCSQIPLTPSPEAWFGGIQVFPHSFVSHEIDREFQDLETNPFPEGAAILEVLHDVAPGARLLYADGRTDVNLELGRLFMKLSGVDVMVENMVYAGAGRYDGSSWISREASEFARTTNTPYFISAGGVTAPVNATTPAQADRFPLMISGHFNPDPRDNRTKVHAWGTSATQNRDEGLSIRGSGFAFDPDSGMYLREGPIVVTLVWDDFWSDEAPRADDDLDLYLVPRDTLDLNRAVATSRRLQNGNGTNPVERLVFYPSDILTPYALVMVRKNSFSNSRTFFTLVIESGQVEEPRYLTHGVPLNNSDALPPVITVGHLNQNGKLGEGIMPSASGPGFQLEASGRFLTWYHGQRFLDVVGYGNVSTVTSMAYSPFDRAFVGPSAAVAHLGGFAALLRHRFPEMPPQQLRHIMMDTSGVGIGGVTVFPTALDVTPQALSNPDGSLKYENSPRYLKPEPINMYADLTEGLISPYSSVPSFRYVPITDRSEAGALTTGWVSGPGEPLLDLAIPEFRVSEMGLELKPSAGKSWGYWYSPPLEVKTEFEDTPRTTLRADRLYVAEVRIGTDETDPTAVPDFRVRLTSGTGEESASLVVAGLSVESEQAPTTLGGKTYRLYYRPSNDAVARQGVHLAFEVINVHPTDNADATLVLREMTFSELYLDGIGVQ